jgi:hypothetical protein
MEAPAAKEVEAEAEAEANRTPCSAESDKENMPSLNIASV